MSYLTLADGVTPATPASAKTRLFTQAGRPATANASGKSAFLGSSAPWNLLRNSGFWFAQRQIPATATTYAPAVGSRAICADGWGISSQQNNISFLRVDTSGWKQNALQSRFYGAFQKSATVGQMMITQVIDGVETDTVRGRTVRLTFKMSDESITLASTDTPVPIQFALLSWTGTVDAMGATLFSGNLAPLGFNGNFDPALVANWAYVPPLRQVGVNCVASANSYIGLSNAAWQTFSGTFQVPTNATNIAVFIWTAAEISSGGASLYLSDAMLTDSEEFYEYTHLGRHLEYLRCARFYQKSFAIDTAPAVNPGANSGEYHFMSPVGSAVAFAGAALQFPVRMYRVGQTLTLYNPSASNAQVHNASLGTDCTLSTINANSESGAWISATTPSSTVAGQHLSVHWTVDSEL